MVSFLMKVIISPIAIMLSDLIFPNVNYANVVQALLIGAILAVAGVAMEYVFLRPGTFWTSNVADLVTAVLIVYFVSQWMPGAVVTFGGAILAALLIGVTEYFQHLYLIKTGKVENTA